MGLLLDKFKDLRELLDIIQFQTGKTLEGVAVGAGYTGAHLRSERGKNNNNKLLEALKKDYGKEIEQFVRKYGELYIEVKKDSLDCGANSGLQDQDPVSFLRKVEGEQRALAQRIDSFLKGYQQHPSKSGTDLPSLESEVVKLHGTGDEKGIGSTDKANRKKKP